MALTGDRREIEDTTDLSPGVAVAKLNYTDIQRLSNADLNEYCRHFNIDISLPKAVKVNAVCHCCDISTTGESQPSLTLTTLPRTAESLDKSQLLELQSMTPKVLYSGVSGREGMEWDDESVCEGNGGMKKKSKTPLSNSWIHS